MNNLNHISAVDLNGIIASEPRKSTKILTQTEAVAFLQKHIAGQIYGPIERAPRDSRRVTVYISKKGGVGRTGRNWLDFMVDDAGEQS
jgi:hypothetical protein